MLALLLGRYFTLNHFSDLLHDLGTLCRSHFLQLLFSVAELGKYLLLHLLRRRAFNEIIRLRQHSGE